MDNFVDIIYIVIIKEIGIIIMNEYEQKWQTILQLLEPEVTDITFKTWFKPLKFISCDENAGILNILSVSYTHLTLPTIA